MARRAAVSDPIATVRRMIIDCGQCTVRGAACADCVVTFLTIGDRPRDVTEGAARAAELDDAERRAVAVLADSGLVPPLRLARRQAG